MAGLYGIPGQIAAFTACTVGIGSVGYLAAKAAIYICPLTAKYVNPLIGFTSPAIAGGCLLGLIGLAMDTQSEALSNLAFVSAAFAPIAVGLALKVPFIAVIATTCLTNIPIFLFVYYIIKNAGQDPFRA